MKSILFTLILSLSAQLISAQFCGGAWCYVKIYTINGVQKTQFTYEVLPLSNEIKEAFKDEHLDRVYAEWVLRPELAKTLNLNDTLDEKFNSVVEYGKLPRKGLVLPEMRFRTTELLHHMVVLRISDGKHSACLLGNIYGGCGNTLNLLWMGDGKMLIGRMH